MLGIKVLKEAIEKTPSAAHCRELARQAVAQKSCSERQASNYFRLNRSTLRYRSKFPCVKQQEIDQAIVDLSLKQAELGSDKVGRLVRKRGLRVSSERVRKVRREESLQVPQRVSCPLAVLYAERGIGGDRGLAQEVQSDPPAPQSGHQDTRRICFRSSLKGRASGSIDFPRCGLRPSLRKLVDNLVANTINKAVSSHLEWNINWKGAGPIHSTRLMAETPFPPS